MTAKNHAYLKTKVLNISHQFQIYAKTLRKNNMCINTCQTELFSLLIELL